MIKKFNNFFEKKDIQNLQDIPVYIKDNDKYVKSTEPLELIQITGILSKDEIKKIEENIFNDIKNNITSYFKQDNQMNKFLYNVNNEISEYYVNKFQNQLNIKHYNKINNILIKLYNNAEKDNIMKISNNILSKIIALYGFKNNNMTKNIISDIIKTEYYQIKKSYNISIDENMTIDKNLNVGEIKRGQIIWLTALLKKPGTSYSNQTLGVIKLRVIDYYYGLNKLSQIMK